MRVWDINSNIGKYILPVCLISNFVVWGKMDHWYGVKWNTGIPFYLGIPFYPIRNSIIMISVENHQADIIKPVFDLKYVLQTLLNLTDDHC